MRTHASAVGRKCRIGEATIHLEDRHIEGATAEIVYSDRLAVLLFVHSVSESSSRGLVDDAKHLQGHGR